jgi:hypothetical protein
MNPYRAWLSGFFIGMGLASGVTCLVLSAIVNSGSCR